MCGICGASADFRAAAVRAMCARMTHRGPDDEGWHVDERCGFALGARRLSIIDPAGGHQPVANEDGSVWAVLNGEIYNHPALQAQLRRRGHSLSSRTDTEVLVHLYEDYGDRLVHALEGMYAFAVWDSRRRRLLLARDRFGEKPLFYHAAEGRLNFASELTALSGAGARLRISAQAVSDFLILGYVSGESSILEDVRQLAPGHLLTWEAESPAPRIERYWTLPQPPATDGRHRRELAAELELLLRQAVRSRLIADVPVGVFLSGGLDSTLVATLAAQEHAGGLRTFNVAYAAGQVNEDRAARRTAERLGAEHAELVLGDGEVRRLVPAALARLDQPNGDPALVPLHALAAHARRQITVALGGEGADELFGGYPRYRWLAVSPVMQRLPSRLSSVAAEAAGRSPGGKRQRLAELVGSRDPLQLHLDWVTGRRFRLMRGLHGPRLRDCEADRPLGEARAVVADAALTDVPSRFMALDRSSWLPDDVLAKADRATMLCSLEMRTPFLERGLAEFALSIAARRHLWPTGKTLLREVHRAVTGLARPPRKTAFRVPTAEWLRGPLQAQLEHHLSEGRLVRDGWLDAKRLGALLSEHRNGADRSALLWPVLTLGCWLEGAGQAHAAD